MVYQRASSSEGFVSSRISLGTEGAMSAIPISSGRFSSSPLLIGSSILRRLDADDTAHDQTEDVVEYAHPHGDDGRDQGDDERVGDGALARRPPDVGELFADVVQIGDE